MTPPAALPPPPLRALVVMAHPDDIEFTCGGAVANLTDAGWAVTFCLVTSGDQGTKDRSLPPSALAALREAEQEAAAKVLGVQRCLFLRWPDGFVEDTPELRGALVRCIRQVAPDLLITWDPSRGFNHRDHRTVGVLTLDAAFPLARSPHSYPDHQETGLLPHRVNEILLAGTREADYFVDVAHQQERKIHALRCHASQVSDSPRRTAPAGAGPRRLRRRGGRGSLGGGLSAAILRGPVGPAPGRSLGRRPLSGRRAK